MSIRFSKYVSIVSGVGGGAAVRTRDLIGRLFTTSPLVPVGAVLEVNAASEVSAIFGASSEEAVRAAFYFSWVSPNISAPRRLSFARFTPLAAPPTVYGNASVKSLSALQAVTSGVLSLVVGGVPVNLSGISFAGALSLADVATALQTAINGSANPQLATATVTYQASSRRFVFTGGVAGAETFDVAQSGTGNTDVGALVGWYAVDGAIISDGADAQTPAQSFNESADGNNNFGAFVFLPRLTLDEVQAVATANEARNVAFMFSQRVSPEDAATWSAALIDTGGVGLTLDLGLVDEFPDMVPLTILAATEYGSTVKRNTVTNYMFKQFPLTPSVGDTLQSDTYDAQRINYYGRTQTAGQVLDFYQRGTLMGQATDPVDMNVYANEIWLKDFIAAQIMSLLLSASRVPANAAGRAQLLAVIQTGIDQALFNGTVSVDKPLTTVQKLFIEQQTGDPLAWVQVQSEGYWVDGRIESYTTPSGATEFRFVYLLIYAKDDAVRKVEGTHTLI